MNKNAMELPMGTIVMIIMVLLVLAAVGIMFFQQFSTGSEGFGSAQCVQLCESIKSQLAANSQTIWSDIDDIGAGASFCDGQCYSKVSCNVRTLKDVLTTVGTNEEKNDIISDESDGNPAGADAFCN